MLRRLTYLWAVALTAILSQLATAQQPRLLGLESGRMLPKQLPSINQQVASKIAHHLRQSGQLRGYHIDIAVNEGRAVLTGQVASEPQREEAVRIVQGVPGVERVLDQLKIVPSPALQRVQFPPAPVTGPAPTESPVSQEPGAAAPPPPTRLDPSLGAAPGAMPEPTPVFRAPVPVAAAMHPPKMPPYAWPTYAPYNNFSRVGYPTAYPYKSFPFIGPFYPFPKVPLGWRSVKLEWDDGYWWFSRTATKYNWWKIKFW